MNAMVLFADVALTTTLDWTPEAALDEGVPGEVYRLKDGTTMQFLDTQFEVLPLPEPMFILPEARA